MDRFFAVFGKLILGAVLLVAVLGAGYYVGTHKIIKQLSSPSSPTQTPLTNSAHAAPTFTPTSTPLPSQAVTKKTIQGGLESGTSFKKYTLQIPHDWIDKKDDTPGVADKLILSKGAYTIVITQAAMGGGGCLYKGDSDSMMAQRFSDFVDITAPAGALRRSWNTDTDFTKIQTYTICQKGEDASFGSPTSLGAISYQTPKNPDEGMLSEMDTIIASLQKQ
jgi:hypothetical protein